MIQCSNGERRRARAVARVTLASTAALAAAAGAARGSLMIDVRAVSATGGTVVQNSKSVNVAGSFPGDVISFNVFALVTGADANSANDGILSFYGSFLSSNLATGAVSGNLVTT